MNEIEAPTTQYFSKDDLVDFSSRNKILLLLAVVQQKSNVNNILWNLDPFLIMMI